MIESFLTGMSLGLLICVVTYGLAGNEPFDVAVVFFKRKLHTFFVYIKDRKEQKDI